MELCHVAILDQIDRLTNDPLSEHSQEVQKLKSAYNQTIKSIRTDISAAPTDILDIFPPEIWIPIVGYALPVRGYSFALLLLTMVSRKWMRKLTSVPTFWAHIELRGSQEDSLATVEAFRQLSREAPVHLSIYVPTRHDQATIRATLVNIGPRIREVTLRTDGNAELQSEETWAVLQLLLTGSQFNSSLNYIHLEDPSPVPLYHESTSEFMKNNLLPPSLRAIRGWNFKWRDFQTNPDCLERLEAIDSCSEMEHVLTHRIQLPELKDLTITRYSWMRPGPEEEEGFPSLQNLTSLTYDCIYREVLMRLLLCVAPQLLYLELRLPCTKIPLLVAALQVAINLRTLMLNVESSRGEDDERENERNVCPVYQHLAGEINGLSFLQLYVTNHGEPRTLEQVKREGSFLSLLMSTISGLYTKLRSFLFIMTKEYPIVFDVVLSYVQSLPELRKLHLEWPDGCFPATKDPYTSEELEYFYTGNIVSAHCFRMPNLLYLWFTWGSHWNLDTLTYANLRNLSIVASKYSVVELPESSFPTLQELTVHFIVYSPPPDVHGIFKLTSFPFLRSITIGSSRIYPYQPSPPQGTMLCLALLSHPSMCPSLCEIKFLCCFPDWDVLFLMLEKRNFMVDSAVSLIRRIAIPFIPRELCAPLASLLGGMYTERPANNDLFMGGARELLLDEQVPGCIECLLRMMGSCKCLVRSATQGADAYRDDQLTTTGVEFAWTEIPEYGDPITVNWIMQRKHLLEEFIVNLAAWSKQYRREASCGRGTEMEITEYGIIAGDYGP